jgi:hypothetical protein
VQTRYQSLVPKQCAQEAEAVRPRGWRATVRDKAANAATAAEGKVTDPPGASGTCKMKQVMMLHAFNRAYQ